MRVADHCELIMKPSLGLPHFAVPCMVLSAAPLTVASAWQPSAVSKVRCRFEISPLMTPPVPENSKLLPSLAVHSPLASTQDPVKVVPV